MLLLMGRKQDENNYVNMCVEKCFSLISIGTVCDARWLRSRPRRGRRQ